MLIGILIGAGVVTAIVIIACTEIGKSIWRSTPWGS